MKTKITLLIGAIVLALGLAGGATSASAQAGATVNVAGTADLQLAHHPFRHRLVHFRLCRRWYYWGYVRGFLVPRIKYRKYCRYSNWRRCQRLYHLGFVRGIRFFRIRYYRYCTHLGLRS